ncbi:MAG: FHA domain-containing protein [Gemmatimonadaceae bacterium]
MPYLELGEDAFELPAGETVVGGGAQCSVRVQRHDLAARHFAVNVPERSDGAATVRAVSPQNVVVVNRMPIAARSTPLSPGDTIAAGSARFHYVLEPGTSHSHEHEPPEQSAHLIDERSRVAYALTRRSVSIGRDAHSTILLTDPQVSRFHADIKSEAGVHVLYASGSAGAHVDGQRVNGPRVLAEGNRIAIANTTLVFTHEALPQGVRIAEGAAPGESRGSQRATTVMKAVRDDGDTGARNSYDGGRRSRVVVLAALLVIVATAAVVFGLP